MSIHPIDLTIIGAYLIAVVIVGFVLSRRAAANIDSYFLGGNTVPWYVLGVSNASSMFDITGTMWLVLMFFVYGVKGGWIPWLWPLFNQIFLAVYLSRWIRRSNVLTGAEWITTRFGESRGAEMSRIAVLVFALVSVVGFLAYAFQGIGKFASVFFPFDLAPETYAIIVMGITTVYVVAGGMYSVVFTDVIQFVLLTIVSISIGYIAFNAVAPEALFAAVPEGWRDVWFGWELDLDWSSLMPAVNNQIAADGWNLFTIFMMMCLFKGVLVSVAGPAPNYDMQRVLATRTPKEAGFMSAIVTLCITPRYFMVVGITTLAMVFYREDLLAMGDSIDFELVLPWVISEFLPVGLVGLLLAGLLAAFMSTFDSTVNAGAAYLVNDLYRRYIRKDEKPRHYVRISYVASLLVVLLGIAFGFMSESINTVTQWIVSGLFGGYTAPNVLKWHWWRFNGVGYFFGMIGGIVAALIFPVLVPELSPLSAFPYVLLISAGASVVASLLTEPDDEETLKDFYRKVRPWGFWRPVLEKVQLEDPTIQPNRTLTRDLTNVGLGVVWQNCFYFFPVLLLVYDYTGFAIALAGAIVTTFILKKTWYDRLSDDDDVDALSTQVAS
jgi:Na+/proline symporter